MLETSAFPGTAKLHPSSRKFPLPVVLAIALRDFRGGLRGFVIFILSIALGVFAITGVGCVSRSIAEGLASEGRAILGGDISFRLAQRELDPAERDFLTRRGRMSEIALMRAMARSQNGDVALVEVKAVDHAYPLAGSVGLEPELPLADALAEQDGTFGIVADAALMAKLALEPGAVLEIGQARFKLRANLVREPDLLAGGVRFGARVLMSAQGLRASGLLEPGSLVHWHYRLVKGTDEEPASTHEAEMETLADEARTAFPDAGWEIRTQKNISPQFSRNLDRFTQFLTLVGLTSLIIGGVGVANAVLGYVERKKLTVATLKSIGATGSTVFGLMLTHVMLVAMLGVAIGAALGAFLPFAAVWGFGSAIPFPITPRIYPDAIAQGVLYGVLTALTFSLWPLGRAHDVPVQALFREEIETARGRPRAIYLFLVAAAALSLAAVAFAFAADRRMALIYGGATLGAFAVLRGFALVLMRGAARLPRPRNVALRLAIGNVHRPGALTPSLVLSLGLGIALVVALAMIDRNMRDEIEDGVPGSTPSFFFVDVQTAETDTFTRFLQSHAPQGRIELVPMLRGRIIKLNGLRAEDARPAEKAAWALHGDRGITFAPALPAGSSLVEGEWWPKDYGGPPLVSLEAEVCEGLGLAIGDEVTVNVLGRSVTARIANTRKVNWRTLGINFVLVFSPNTFAGAPYANLATLTFPDRGETSHELALLREAARAFPPITSIRVKDALESVNKVLAQLTIAARVASSITLLSSILVLGGALAAGQQARIRDAVVLKTLGATRRRLIAAFLYEFGFIGLMTAVFAVAAGGAAAFAIVRHVMDIDFVWLWGPPLTAVAAALIVTIVLGLLGTWHILGRKPAPYLRDL